ncbi:MAG: hypothetical protein HC923_02895 [Myxococcales bacterium]|nr:hypothetical protein [Myxococcales bacterium]
MQAASDLVQMDIESLITHFRDRFHQYLSAFSDQRLSDSSFGRAGSSR